MCNRMKVAEPVWSSNAGKENTIDQQARAEIKNVRRRSYRPTNKDKKPSDCYNCKKGWMGVCCIPALDCSALTSLEYCSKKFTHCQFWERKA
jgi:hypothetical protein